MLEDLAFPLIFSYLKHSQCHCSTHYVSLGSHPKISARKCEPMATVAT